MPSAIDGWIQTFSGKMFMLAAPRPDDVEIGDIAVALSRIPRFNGHTQQFYSVAQHAVLVADLLLPHELRLVGLLHDAAEAFVGDFTRPLKGLYPELEQIEQRVWQAIAARFDLPLVLPPEVKHADLVLLATEQRDLMGPPPWPWHELPSPLEETIVPWQPFEAYIMFLNRFEELTGLT